MPELLDGRGVYVTDSNWPGRGSVRACARYTRRQGRGRLSSFAIEMPDTIQDAVDCYKERPYGIRTMAISLGMKARKQLFSRRNVAA